MNTLILLIACGVGSPPAAPLQCRTPLAAKGEVKGGPPLIHTFELTHPGAGILTITKVAGSCGCFRQTLSTSILAAGDSAKLAVEVNTLTQPNGSNRWQVVVVYQVEAPGAPIQTGELLLQITANLTREVSVTPAQLGFSTAGAASQVVTIDDIRAKKLTVLKATTSTPHMIADVSPREAGKGQRVTVKLAQDAPIGQRDETLVLSTDDPAYPELRIPVRVLKRAAGGIRVAPEAVSLRFAAGQSELSTLVQLRAGDGKPVQIASAESELPGVMVKCSSGAAPVAVVRVTVTEEIAKQTGTCQVRVRLARPAGQEVVIPVAWTRAMK
jgi:hypothetical protein